MGTSIKGTPHVIETARQVFMAPCFIQSHYLRRNSAACKASKAGKAFIIYGFRGFAMGSLPRPIGTIGDHCTIGPIRGQ